MALKRTSFFYAADFSISAQAPKRNSRFKYPRILHRITLPIAVDFKAINHIELMDIPAQLAQRVEADANGAAWRKAEGPLGEITVGADAASMNISDAKQVYTVVRWLLAGDIKKAGAIHPAFAARYSALQAYHASLDASSLFIEDNDVTSEADRAFNRLFAWGRYCAVMSKPPHSYTALDGDPPTEDADD